MDRSPCPARSTVLPATVSIQYEQPAPFIMVAHSLSCLGFHAHSWMRPLSAEMAQGYL